MSITMSLRQLLVTPITWRPNPDVEKERQAHRLLLKCEGILRGLERRKNHLRAQIQRCASGGDAKALRKTAQELAEVLEEEKRLVALMHGRTSTSDAVFVFSSLLLLESFRFATQSADEWLHCVIGVDIDGMVVGTQIVTFPYTSQSAVGVSADHAATHRMMIETHEAGHRIVAILHSHPGAGVGANHHSSTDSRTQREWERSSEVISGVWSRDGYLRWFSNRLRFNVEIIGNYVEKMDEHLFKISTSEDLQVLMP